MMIKKCDMCGKFMVFNRNIDTFLCSECNFAVSPSAVEKVNMLNYFSESNWSFIRKGRLYNENKIIA